MTERAPESVEKPALGTRPVDAHVGRPLYDARTRYPKLRGEKLCRGCGATITEKYRRTWCSQACKDKYDPMTVLQIVRARDKHICQLCGVDIGAALKAWEKKRYAPGATYEELRGLGRLKPKEEYDHITPFSEGGLTTPENLRTLCVECHRKRTAEWHRERAAARRLEKQPELFAPNTERSQRAAPGGTLGSRTCYG